MRERPRFKGQSAGQPLPFCRRWGCFVPPSSFDRSAVEDTHFVFILLTLCLSFQRCRRADCHKDNGPLVALGNANAPRSEACEDVEYVKHTLVKAAENTDTLCCLAGKLHPYLVTNTPCLYHSEVDFLRSPCDLPPLEPLRHVRSKAQWWERNASKDTH